MFKLVIQDDEGKTTVVPLIRDEITIGRKEGNTIRLTERNVSRRHARILRNNGEVQIEDLGSYNGIRVNNARIAERVSLRVSDQVQIGDYKLYLKAEGVEQVDDARTMPIERIENVQTEPIPVLNATAHAAPAASGLAPPQIVGNPNRTQVAIADTDPAGGRPVATAAAVAAMSAATGYGKLVALSSNFAGKQFELSRPQMIVGRTDENDIVINHRSISRNHAKLVREPETGRYTISDLQSSNGVRVNGQDYGKVELRRGDVVDLGHVRLRFVEAGEDFVFERDAVITDVPESTGKRGVMVAVVLAILVLGGLGAFLLLKTGSDAPMKGSDNGVADTSDAGSVAVVPPPAAPDATLVAVATPDALEAIVNPIDDKGAMTTECRKNAADRKWQDLLNCTQKLASLDPGLAKELKDKAVSETRAELALDKLGEDLRDGDLKKAKTEYDKIGGESVYRQEAQTKYDQSVKATADEFAKRARPLAAAHNCTAFRELVKQADDSKGTEVGDAVRSVGCKEKEVARDPTHVVDPGHGSNTTAVTNPPPAACDDTLQPQVTAAYSSGLYGKALGLAEQYLKCKPADTMILKFAFQSACHTGKAAQAKLYYGKLGGNVSVQTCVTNGIMLP